MENPTPWLIWLLGLTILSLVQALVLVLRLSQGRTNKKTSKPENPSHGERLMGLETDVEALKEGNDKDHLLIRQSIDKLSIRINGLRK